MDLLLMRRQEQKSCIIRWFVCIRMLGKCRKICDCSTFIIALFFLGFQGNVEALGKAFWSLESMKRSKSLFLKMFIKKYERNETQRLMYLQKTLAKASKQIGPTKIQIPLSSGRLMRKTAKSSSADQIDPSKWIIMGPKQNCKSLNDYFQENYPDQFAQDQQQVEQTPKPSKYVQLILTKEQLDQAKQLLQNVSRMRNHNGQFFQQDIESLQIQFGICPRKVREIKRQFIKDPTLSSLYYKAEQKKKKHDTFMQLLEYYIDATMKKTPNLSMQNLVNEVKKKIPIKYKKQVKLPVVQYLLQKRQKKDIISEQSQGFQLLNLNSKNTVNLLQYSKSILRVLDQNKLLFFLGTDVVATQKQATVENQQRKIILRGVLGSNMIAFWDIFIGASDYSHQNRSLLNLLTIIKKKNQQQQIHLAMSRQFMDEYKESLRSVSAFGFIFIEFGQKAKNCNPLKYWFKDLKELANNYDVKTRVKFQESFQHICSLLDRKNYAVYFNTCLKQMRAIVEDSKLQNPLKNIK